MDLRRPTTLVNLASDVVRAISNLIDAHDLCSLWLAGDRHLCLLLRLSVSRFELVYTKPLQLFWPALISQFTNLKELVLEISKDITGCRDMWLWNTNLSDVPRGIRKLDFAFGLDFALFLHCKDVRHSDNFSMMNLRNSFPKLEEFRCRGTTRIRALAGKEICSIWPETLQSVVLRECDLVQSDIALLPRGLRLLDCRLGQRAFWGDCANPFPSSLQTLRLSNVVDVRVFGYVPPTVTDLALAFFPESTSEAVHGWNLLKSPEMLVSLSVANQKLDVSVAPYVPPHLTALKFSLGMEIPMEVIENLPPRLQIIAARLPHSGLRPLVAAKFPRSLKRMSYTISSHIACTEWKDLPRSLEEFYCDHRTFPSSSFLADLPPALTALDIHDLRSTDFVSLPPTLKVLQIYSYRQENFGSGIGHMYRLSALEELTMHNALDRYNLESLDHPLKVLHFAGNCNPNDYDFTKIWASKLVSLTIHMENLPDDMIEFIRALPATLELLDVRYSSTVDAKVLSVLPPLLRVCMLDGIEFLNGLSLARLSARVQLSLLAIRAAGRGCELRESDLESLPRSLEEIVLPITVSGGNIGRILDRHLPRFRRALLDNYDYSVQHFRQYFNHRSVSIPDTIYVRKAPPSPSQEEKSERCSIQ